MRSFALALCLLSAGPALAEDPLVVEFFPVQKQQLFYEGSLTGSLHAERSLDLGFRQSGRVIEMSVQEGDRVQAGDALARIDPVQQNQALLVAEAALSAARATQEQAQQAYDRASAMLQRGVGTRASRDEAQQALSQAQGVLEATASQADQARRAADETVLRAPADAVVTARQADPGQIVGAAQPVVSLAVIGGLEAVFQTPDVAELDKAMGLRILLEPIDVDAPDLSGRITEIAPLVDPETGSVTLRARVQDPPDDIRLLGAAVRGTVEFEDGMGFVVPWTALTRDGPDPAVWLVGDDGRVSITKVQVERFDNGDAYLKAGVEEGQTVVAAGSQMLYPGRLVTDAAALQADLPAEEEAGE